MSSPPQAETTERRSAAIGEAAVVVGAGLAAAWLIPGQTTHGPVLGLSPAFLPTACTVAIIALGLLGLCAAPAGPQPLQPERTAPSWPAALILGWWSPGSWCSSTSAPLPAASSIVALGLAVLGRKAAAHPARHHRRLGLILVITFQPWR